MDHTTRIMFLIFSGFVMILLHWNMRQLSGVNSSCVLGHQTTLTYLDDFKSSLLQSDLLLAFVDKADLLEIQKEKKEALQKVSLLTKRLKSTHTDLAILKQKLMNAERLLKNVSSDSSSRNYQHQHREDLKQSKSLKSVDSKRISYRSNADMTSIQPCDDSRKSCTREKEFMLQAKMRLKHLRERIVECEKKLKKGS